MATLNILATHEPFELFLERHASYEIVGTSLDKDDCPIARFLRGKGFPRVVVSSTSVYTEGLDDRLGINTSLGRYLLPTWARNFIVCVDRRADPANRYDHLPITAEAARTALRSALDLGDTPTGMGSMPLFSLCGCTLCKMAAGQSWIQPPSLGIQQAPMPNLPIQLFEMLQIKPQEVKELVPA